MWETPESVEPTPASSSDKSDQPKKFTWKKNGAPTSEYILKYTNTSGDTKYVHENRGSSSFTVPSSARAVPTDKQMEDGDKQKATVDGFAVRVKGNAGSNPYTAPSEWAVWGDINPEADVDDLESYDSWGDLFEGITAKGGSGSSSKNSSNNKIGPGQTLNGWVGSGEKWYYYNNGQTVKGWVNDGGTWYYCNPVTGLMETGWVIANFKTYYLNPNHGGPFGAMVTGTQTIDGKTYNFAASGEVM